MANSAVLHPLTEQRISAFLAAPSHALLIIGTPGIGKATIAQLIITQLLGVSPDKLDNQPYLRIIGVGKERSISIDKIRELEQFLSRKVPGDAKRVVLIEDAHLLGVEAQNALLKTLEEPPLNTVVLLTVGHEQALLPTIRSRAPALIVQRPKLADIQAFFSSLGYDAAAITRAHAMSGGMPGLMAAILQDDSEHPLVQAATVARQIVQGSMFDRLAMVDTLSKDREQCLRVLGVLQQMSRVSLRADKNAAVWQRILTTCHTAIGELLGNGQPKLILTNLMLSM